MANGDNPNFWQQFWAWMNRPIPHVGQRNPVAPGVPAPRISPWYPPPNAVTSTPVPQVTQWWQQPGTTQKNIMTTLNKMWGNQQRTPTPIYIPGVGWVQTIYPTNTTPTQGAGIPATAVPPGPATQATTPANNIYVPGVGWVKSIYPTTTAGTTATTVPKYPTGIFPAAPSGMGTPVPQYSTVGQQGQPQTGPTSGMVQWYNPWTGAAVPGSYVPANYNPFTDPNSPWYRAPYRPPKHPGHPGAYGPGGRSPLAAKPKKPEEEEETTQQQQSNLAYPASLYTRNVSWKFR